ncbi:MAG: deaminase [Candidatus Adlerbacteria bacterium]
MVRNLILYVPVIHRGYIDLFATHKDEIGSIYLLPDSFTELVALKPDIASLPAESVAALLNSFGFKTVSVFKESDISKLAGEPLMLINDQLSRALAAKFFLHSDLKWADVFLRWDRDSVFTEEDINISVSKDSFDVQTIQQAQIEAKKSSDWWRQVGAVLVKNSEIVDRAFNEAMFSDHSPYQRGAVRDSLQPGERPELSDTIHAEQKIIANAAKNGVSLEGASLYVTHFPCPVCAKLIVHSGIKNCYFLQGSSSLKGRELLENAGVNLARIGL